MHQHRGTLSAVPNFAYEILATKVPDDELHGLDLSGWRVAVNGAEPVHASTLARFAERFRAHGFDPHSMMPVYGLAESCVGLAFPPLGRGPKIDCIDRQALHAIGHAQPVTADEAALSMQVVCCGQPLAGHEIRVVDAQGAELPERSEGRVEFRGPSATSGYLRNSQATRTLFHGQWLDTGDVGYIAEGELYLTSRVKDLIIRGGHNIHPYDLEDAIGSLPGVRKGCVAVFGATDPASATDRVVVLAETRVIEPERRAALRERIAELSIALLGLPADDIVLADARTVLKTSSGKIRRAACSRKRTARWIARVALRASMLPLSIEGVEHLKTRPAVVAVNHASYIDWLLLTAVLPAEMSFVAKRELARSRPLCWVLSRMGTRFVERDDVHGSVEDAKTLLQVVQAGESLVFFPEGTLTRAPGLRGFHMGAFVTAAQAGVALLPVSLRGTRSVLRDGSWRPRRHPVQVHVHVPLRAQGTGWHEALQLRDAARERIAATCGEPLLPI